MTHLGKNVDVVQDVGAFNCNAERASTSAGLIHLNHVQFNGVSTVENRDFISEVTITLRLEYGAAIANRIGRAVHSAAGEIRIGRVVNVIV